MRTAVSSDLFKSASDASSVTKNGNPSAKPENKATHSNDHHSSSRRSTPSRDRPYDHVKGVPVS